MSAMNLVQILCDDSEECEQTTGAWIGLGNARRVAASRGWTSGLIGGEVEDFCPNHPHEFDTEVPADAQ